MTPPAKATMRCSFCAKPSTEVDKLVAGPGVMICDECVGLAQAIVEEHRGRPHTVRLPIWASMTNEQMLEHIPRIAAVAEQVETDLRAWVTALRNRGVTWSKVGDALGITRQSAWERFSQR